ncbi:MAG: VWA domain-containing protein [Oscillospiraceae bacterium]|nr:VWA domain-containing protein [Oscillospiraceae bacterium]
MTGSMPDLYDIDIVICLDGSRRMGPYLSMAKEEMAALLDTFVQTMEKKDQEVAQLRARYIVFRDYACDGEPMVESPFFTLPEQYDAFRDYLDAVEPRGGGEAQNGLEALALALLSDWTTGKEKLRQIVWIFSAGAELPLGERADCPAYPGGLPKSFEELGDWWEGNGLPPGSSYQPSAGRLIAFVPKKEPWIGLDRWKRVLPAFLIERTGFRELNREAAALVMASPNK